jgi:HTH-type transcriptional regulator, competence development regulator
MAMPEAGLGVALRTLREKRGLQVREVATLAAVDHAYIYRLESGKKANPSEEILSKLLKTLKPSDRDADIVRWLADQPVAYEKLVEYVLGDPDIEFEAFMMAAGVRHRGQTRPDPQTLIRRAQHALQASDDE